MGPEERDAGPHRIEVTNRDGRRFAGARSHNLPETMPETRYIPIPAGTPSVPCRSCRAVIYFAPHPSSGRSHPISIDTKSFPNAKAPTPHDAGQGGSHFIDCPNAKDHRRSK